MVSPDPPLWELDKGRYICSYIQMSLMGNYCIAAISQNISQVNWNVFFKNTADFARLQKEQVVVS